MEKQSREPELDRGEAPYGTSHKIVEGFDDKPLRSADHPPQRLPNFDPERLPS